MKGKEEHLRPLTTWIKYKVIMLSIRNLISIDERKVKIRHDKKFTFLINERNERNGIQPNPNKLIFNLSHQMLSNEQHAALQYGLKQGIAMRPNEKDMMAESELIWEQIERNNLCKDGHSSIQRAKNILRGMTFNNINYDNRQFHLDNKRIKVIKELQKDLVILKPDNGEAVVLIERVDYVTSLEGLFQITPSLKK